MKMLEFVSDDNTAEEVVATSIHMAPSIGKIAALVVLCPVFVCNRILA